MKLNIQLEQEIDGRWIAEIVDLPGVIVYGSSLDEAILKVKVLALRVIAERIESGEFASDNAISFVEAAA